MLRRNVLLIADDEKTWELTASALSGELKLVRAKDSETAASLMQEHNPGVIILHLALPPNPTNPEAGLTLLRELQFYGAYRKIIVISGFCDRELASEAFRLGAYDFLTKPVDLGMLKVLVQRASWIAELQQERANLQSPEAEEIQEMIGTSDSIRRTFATIRKVATADIPVLITGESGTGKELTAKAIHERSHRKEYPFVTINCGAIPETLLESELFGYEKGAFTGAWQQMKGKLEYAHGGSLFLDEIGELPPPLQVKLLRFLQDQTIERVGGRKQIAVDARIIAATNVDLQQLISQGKFREDLYYRLRVVSIELPPLRERGEDVLLMAQVFLRKVVDQMRKPIIGFSKQAIQAIQSHCWPGNVRELINKIRRAVVMTDGTHIEPEDLDLALSEEDRSTQRLSLKEARGRAEANALMQALLTHNWNMRRVARELEITPPTLYHLLRKHGLGGRGGTFRPEDWLGVKFPQKPSH
jgi:two-component system NtrC family response regulator